MFIILPNTTVMNHMPFDSPKLTTLYILLSVGHTIHHRPMIVNIVIILVAHVVYHERRLLHVNVVIAFNLVRIR